MRFGNYMLLVGAVIISVAWATKLGEKVTVHKEEGATDPKVKKVIFGNGN